MSITRDEWIAELERLSQQRPVGSSGMSLSELAEASGQPRTRIRRLLHEAQQAGRLVCFHEVRESLDGVHRSVPTYALKK